jgi:hypothetical protein
MLHAATQRTSFTRGIYTVAGDSRYGLIIPGPYFVHNGVVDYLHFAWKGDSTNNLNGAIDLLAAYCACKRYNADHPAAPRYSTGEMSNWLAAAKTAIGVVAVTKHWPDNAWLGTWDDAVGQFNDTYGYLARTASSGLQVIALLPTPLTTDELDTQYSLWHDIIYDGAQFYIDKWGTAGHPVCDRPRRRRPSVAQFS